MMSLNFFLAAILSFSSTPKHDFHTSITTAELNARSKSFEITMKLFTDDLENSVVPMENENADKLIYVYLRENFILKSGATLLPYEYVGKEMENGITFIYLEIKEFPAVKELFVRNTVFFDRFDDQTNIVNIEIGGVLKSAFLTGKERAARLTF